MFELPFAKVSLCNLILLTKGGREGVEVDGMEFRGEMNEGMA